MSSLPRDLLIRPATTDDATSLALLARVTFAETFEHLFKDRNDMLEYFDTTFSVSKIENSLAKANNVYWLAFVNRLPVGYAKLKIHSKSEFIASKSTSQLQKIYVLNDYLSMKIGFELQNQLFAKVKAEHQEKVWLSVYPHNKRALDFYLKNDFEKVGDHSYQIGKEIFDFYAMVKTF